MQLLPAGPDALLVECSSGEQAAALAAEVVRRRAAGELHCIDVVPAARTVLIDGIADHATFRAALTAWRYDPASTDQIAAGRSRSVVEVRVAYDGPDLPRVARLWGIDPEQVGARHAALEHTVQFCGFAPGFAYVRGLPDELAVPRLERPRAAVPAGAVGLADRFTGIYPTASPGGWQLIGRAIDVVLFDPDRDPPALLSPGTTVRFLPTR